nr:hypothetical protein [uncultured Psychroserpens sp.]
MFLIFFVTALVSAQNNEIALEEICTDTFKAETFETLLVIKNEQHYSVLNSGKKSFIKPKLKDK